MGTRNLARCAVAVAALAFSITLFAADPPPPTLSITVNTNGGKTLSWGPLVPALEVLRVVSGVDLLNMSTDNTGAFIKTPDGYIWGTTNSRPRQFFAVEATHISSNNLLAYNVLNRLAYGPTPDDLERVLPNPQAYVYEQLQPQNIVNTYDAYTAVNTNGVTLPPATTWTSVSVTGIVTSSSLYMYMVGVGNLYIDDIQLRLLNTVISTNEVYTTNMGNVTTNTVYTTNTVVGPNVLVNGGFETNAAGAPIGWTVSPNLSASNVTTNYASEGTSSLHMISTAGGSTQGSSIWQNILPALPAQRRCVLSFSYIQNQTSDLLTLRLSGSGVIVSGKKPPGDPLWIYARQTGVAGPNPVVYVFISGAGEGYIDDIQLVRGSTPGVGPNLLANGDFEQPLSTGWQVTTNFYSSYVDNTVSRSGSGSLHIVATAGGSGNGNAIFQANIPGLTNGQTYTVSYWYRPATRARTTTVRLSGSGLVSSPDSEPGNLRRRLDNADWGVSLSELRSWFCGNAVGSPQQLLEVLTQFFENHFVTYHSKTVDYLDRFYDDFALMDRIAADLEYREVSRWRQALLNPNCTFYDLLKIHVESPAQIIYLDTVGSRGDVNRIANENYARELFELFAMGVDNGYDQNDIVAMSRAWTGWTVDLVRRDQIDNPFADRRPEVQQYGFYNGAGFNAVSNRIGVWTFVYDPAWHGTNRADPLSEWVPNTPATNPVASGPKRYVARLGPPWAGQPYSIQIPPRTGTNSIEDGYDVIRSLGDNIHTAEYISVKLCRLFIHDEFPNPTTHTNLPEYQFYNYANPNRSAEAELVRRCIVAWDTPGPDGRKGHIRAVLRTIFDSELFRSHAGSMQKVKTPLEFVISAVRAFRSVNADGTATAGTGNSSFNTQLSRMGTMSLFNRADPDGYPEDGPPWISAGTLAERLRFVQTLVTAGTRGDDAGNATADPVALIRKKLPASDWYNANAIATYLLRLLYPAEGMANLAQYHQNAVNFLNTADNGTGIDLLRPSMPNADYETRIRGLAAMLMTLQRFQEQ